MAVFTDPKPKMVINTTTAQALNVKIPEDMLAGATVVH
jgi:ABC-type uncharacterized transport system substrate-binding protein